MLQQGKQFKEMSVLELKAIAYDLIAQREENTRQLQMVNQEIFNKLNPQTQPVVEGEIVK